MTEPVCTPAEALGRLLEGNRRFVADEGPVGETSHTRRLETARGQRPFATLVGCSDSRVGPEQLFGTGLGDLFIVRNAGNAVGTHALGSIEFSVAKLGVPLIVVLGHERCGAVEAAVDVVVNGASYPGSIGRMVQDIVPAVEEIRAGGDGPNILDASIRENVRRTVAALRGTGEAAIAGARAAGDLWIVGAYYDLESGVVAIIEPEH